MGEIVASYVKKRSTEQISAFRKEEEQAIRPETIFHSIDQSNLPPHEKAPERMAQEGITILAAGSETSARVIAHTLFHLLLDPDTLGKVREEIEVVGMDLNQLPDVRVLENLPWLVSGDWAPMLCFGHRSLKNRARASESLSASAQRSHLGYLLSLKKTFNTRNGSFRLG